MVLINLPAQVFRAGFAQNYTAFSESTEFRLDSTNPSVTSMSLSIPRQILAGSVSFTLQTKNTVNVLRICTARLRQGSRVIASYNFTATNITPIQFIVEQTLTYPSILQSTDVFTWEVTNEDVALVDAERIQFLGTVSVQGTPI